MPGMMGPVLPGPGAPAFGMHGFMPYMTWIYGTLVIAVFLYFVISETLAGATIGKRLVKIRTASRAAPDVVGLPFETALLREAVKIAGFLPVFAAQFWIISPISDATGVAAWRQMMMPGGQWFFIHLAGQFLALSWLAWIAISLVTDKDPVYDRIAGTTVVRE